MCLGFHLSIAGSLRGAVFLAQVLGCQALQIFVQNPRGWKWRSVGPKEIEDFVVARRLAGLGPLLVHLGYLPNLATADPALYDLSTTRLFRVLALARDLAADYLVVHPGHGPLGEVSFQRVVRVLAQAVSHLPPPPLILLENTAGQGQELGWRFQHLDRIITLSGVPLGLCLDTAHAWGAGYNLGSPHGVARLLADIARGPGLEALKIIHLNDSRTPCNARRDRHWHLGQGAIGLGGLRYFLGHPWLKPEAAIMETPKQHQGHKWVNLLAARSLVAGMPRFPGGLNFNQDSGVRRLLLVGFAPGQGSFSAEAWYLASNR
jgi:deoxyribonuclease-4